MIHDDFLHTLLPWNTVHRYSIKCENYYDRLGQIWTEQPSTGKCACSRREDIIRSAMDGRCGHRRQSSTRAEDSRHKQTPAGALLEQQEGRRAGSERRAKVDI